MKNENGISKVTGLNIFLSVSFAIITTLFVHAKFTYYIASIHTLILTIIFFVLPYFLCKKYDKIARINITIISLILFVLTLFYAYEPIILEKFNYSVSAEYVNADVIGFRDAKTEGYFIYETSKARDIEYSSWGKYKLKSNGKVVRLNNVPKNNVGDNVNLVKLEYTNNNALIKKFIVYMPSNYKVKFFKKNKDNIVYKDIINNLNIILNTKKLRNNKITFSSTPYSNSINFSIYTKENINDYLLNFSENSNNQGMKSILETNYGKLFIYNEKTKENYIHAILKLTVSSDYIIISAASSSLPFDINNDIEFLNQYFKEIVQDKSMKKNIDIKIIKKVSKKMTIIK